ncbi:methyltransferase [Amycolatopsis mediterranei S699]|uniref:S-adenosyl-L-methionine-dependent methyltransferase n=1 Tax=Amycolatopsis mediterranei (strain S699) TaxID=713604 RepID=A0A9R0P0U0_AMYMS|nr:methyltransferase [Amycolatopsis mediterranei S699]
MRQIVLLGAGLDTRAFRLGRPAAARVFEVDLPEVFEFKEAVLAEQGATAAAERIVVGFDLRDAWAGPLTAVGFDAAQPTAWLGRRPVAVPDHAGDRSAAGDHRPVVGARQPVRVRPHGSLGDRPGGHARDRGHDQGVGRGVQVDPRQSGGMAGRPRVAGRYRQDARTRHPVRPAASRRRGPDLRQRHAALRRHRGHRLTAGPVTVGVVGVASPSRRMLCCRDS